MVYVKSLPKMAQLRRLAREIKDYPVSDLGIIQYAEHYGYDDEIVDFLKLFYHQMIFKTRSEFLNYCSLLERIMKEEGHSSLESLQSQED